MNLIWLRLRFIRQLTRDERLQILTLRSIGMIYAQIVRYLPGNILQY